jgi:CBS domain containing-hemolysin-like protein
MWRLGIIIALTAISSFFASSETAITGVNRIRMKHKAENGDNSVSKKAAKKVLKLLEKYDRMLATLLIGNNIVTLIIASLGTLFAIDMANALDWDEGMVVAGVTAILTITLIVFSDILPKTLAREHADSYVLKAGGVLAFTMWIFSPISYVTMLLQRGVTKVFARGGKEVSVTEEELHRIIDEIEDEGVLEEHEGDLVRSALEFDETTVEEILTPRVALKAVALSDSPEKVRDTFLREGYSRLPVYDATLDKIVGLISHKAFMKQLLTAGADELYIKDILQDVVRLPALMKLSDALKCMQRQKSHLAVVLDQYGGTAGIVTLEDILEELVGEIWDESDEEKQPIMFTDANSFEVFGELSINDFNRFFEDSEVLASYNISIDSDSNTVGGWVFELFGKIPEAGETVVKKPFKEITVLSMEGRRPGRLLFKV